MVLGEKKAIYLHVVEFLKIYGDNVTDYLTISDLLFMINESGIGLVQLALNLFFRVLFIRVPEGDGIHGDHVRQPPWSRRRHFHFRLVFKVAFELEGVSVSGVSAEAFEACHHQDFVVAQSFSEQPKRVFILKLLTAESLLDCFFVMSLG
jgi:hypothetical protein